MIGKLIIGICLFPLYRQFLPYEHIKIYYKSSEEKINRHPDIKNMGFMSVITTAFTSNYEKNRINFRYHQSFLPVIIQYIDTEKHNLIQTFELGTGILTIDTIKEEIKKLYN